jgi:hypothetical protein
LRQAPGLAAAARPSVAQERVCPAFYWTSVYEGSIAYALRVPFAHLSSVEYLWFGNVPAASKAQNVSACQAMVCACEPPKPQGRLVP